MQRVHFQHRLRTNRPASALIILPVVIAIGIGGEIYVNGWLATDYSVKGKITITSDEKYFETFDFRAVLLK